MNSTEKKVYRFQVTFVSAVSEEAAFLHEWFSRPDGYRQSWARLLLNLGWIARGANYHQATPLEIEDHLTDSIYFDSVNRFSIGIKLRADCPDDDRILMTLENLPSTRKTLWLRETIIKGYQLLKTIPVILLSINHDVMQGGGKMTSLNMDRLGENNLRINPIKKESIKRSYKKTIKHSKSTDKPGKLRQNHNVEDDGSILDKKLSIQSDLESIEVSSDNKLNELDAGSVSSSESKAPEVKRVPGLLGLFE